ncbi:MAG: GAP family protein [Mycobacterium sp.]|uniref:GAP family protein n=1 Tax=Mycobacterium sp. TaxID=1785 RepID=UPI001EB41853|nr:GAP family protein [Mycobacterium sp.]MBW0017753.1 GAP family protein [Mycobacterium sp.]
MWTTVLVLALMTATEPVRLGMAIFLITRPRPMVNLLAFWFGGMTTGVTVALGVLLLMRDVASIVMHHLTSFLSSSTVAHIQIGAGLVALVVAGLIAAGVTVRQPAPVLVASGEPSAVLVAERPGRFARLLANAHGALETGFPWLAYVVGLSSAGPPPVEYLMALTAIGASGAALGTQVSAVGTYLLVMLAIVEIPLASYLIKPSRTEAAMLSLREWLRTHRRRILAGTVAVAGVALIAAGLGV